MVIPLAEYGHVQRWGGFKSTADEYFNFSCLLCTANVCWEGSHIAAVRHSVVMRLNTTVSVYLGAGLV